MKLSPVRSSLALATVLALGSLGCDQAPAIVAEKLPTVTPDLPAVPQIPPPPAAYPDGSLPVARLRRLMDENLDHEVTVTGYIVEIYQAPECPRGQQCPRPLIPHYFLADAANEADETRRLMVIGYAQTWDELETLIRLGDRAPANMDGTPRSPVDFAVGNKVVVTGNFVTSSVLAAGFQSTAGLLDYVRHTTAEVAAPAAP